MFEGLPNNENEQNAELEVKSKEKIAGFPSDKLGEDEDTIREIFEERLNSSELYSMLLVLLSKNVEKKTPTQVLKEFSQSNLLELSPVGLEDYAEMDQLFISELQGKFEPVALSPISPAGAASVVNQLDPKTMLHTIRNSELVADSSIVLALESAKRRKTQGLKGNTGVEKLATSHRELRTQKFSNPDFTPHYASFTISSASRDVGRFDFEKGAMAEHLDYFLSVFERLQENPYYQLGETSVEISDISILEKIIERGLLDRMSVSKALRTVGSMDYFSEINLDLPKRLETMQDLELPEDLNYLNVPIQNLKKFETDYLPVLQNKYPKAKFIFRLDRSAGIGYFDGPCYKIRVSNSQGEQIPLVDGGCSGWTGKFLSDSSERFFGSGLGTDILIKKFNKKYEQNNSRSL